MRYSLCRWRQYRPMFNERDALHVLFHWMIGAYCGFWRLPLAASTRSWVAEFGFRDRTYAEVRAERWAEWEGDAA